MDIEVRDGIVYAPGARLIDRTGRRVLPIGRDGFEPAAESFVLVDKTMLIADVLDSGYAATLFCRPRRFGKTLNMTMLRAFLEDAPDGRSRAALFKGTEVWEASNGCYRKHQGAYPVVHVSLNTAKKDTWEASYGEIRNLVAVEYERHAYLANSDKLSTQELGFFDAMRSGAASDADVAGSLAALCRLLYKHHGRRVVLLVDEYDAPVMAGYSAPGGGYYREVVTFLKGWLTGAIKDGGAALAFACLTGVQRISKESIFSDLNNLVVSTALDARFDERYGFTDAEVEALATYLGHAGCMAEARAWYDGYRFGGTDVYNPWSVLNYLDTGCCADVYWGNTSGNAVVGDLVRRADVSTMEDVYRLLEPGGTVAAPLDLGIVFPEVGLKGDALWSMLYLAGYLTTADTALPNNTRVPRRLRIPNHEVSELYRTEVVERFAGVAGGRRRLDALHLALVSGDAAMLQEVLGGIVRDAASSFDLVSENACHMLLLGLLFGISGYGDPSSNRESGFGRYDIRLEPVDAREGSYVVASERPRITVELKYQRDAPEDELAGLARQGVAQIGNRGYDVDDLPVVASGRLRWGIAFSGKRVAATCERA